MRRQGGGSFLILVEKSGWGGGGASTFVQCTIKIFDVRSDYGMRAHPLEAKKLSKGERGAGPREDSVASAV